MPKNYNIVTKSVNPSVAGTAVAVGSSVAVGMTRYVTFIAITPRDGSHLKGRRLWFCSTSTATNPTTSTLASAAAKLKVVQTSAASEINIQFPRFINTERPLFSIAASNFLTLHQSSATNG